MTTGRPVARTDPSAPEVAVIGSGPVGMTAAVVLAAQGVRVTVLEAQVAPVPQPKAISIDDVSLRLYQTAGIADAILPIVMPGTGTEYLDRTGRPLFHARGPEPYRLGFPFKNPFAQPELERVLREVLHAHPLVDLRFGATVVDCRPHDSPVEVEIENADGTRESLQADYVVAADGARSTIRQVLQIAMTGHSHPEQWLVVDTLDDHHQERHGIHVGDPSRPLVIVPGQATRCRYEFRLFEGEAEDGPDPAFDLIAGLLAPHRTIRPDQVERATVYRFHGLCADRWRVGRVFLAGDAAHMMPPFAGQGLNSGLRDVENLCWKIAAILRGDLTPDILDTYESERRPHAQATIRLSERLGRVVMTTSPRLAERRDAWVRRTLAKAAGRRYLESMAYRPATHFEDGLVVSDHTAPEGSLLGVTLAQPRVYDVRESRVRLLDEVTGPGWAVLGTEVPPDAWATTADLRRIAKASAVHATLSDTMPRCAAEVRQILEVDGGLTAALAGYRSRFLLIRPDHVVAATWACDDATRAAQVLDRMRGWAGVDLGAASTSAFGATPLDDRIDQGA